MCVFVFMRSVMIVIDVLDLLVEKICKQLYCVSKLALFDVLERKLVNFNNGLVVYLIYEIKEKGLEVCFVRNI